MTDKYAIEFYSRIKSENPEHYLNLFKIFRIGMLDTLYSPQPQHESRCRAVLPAVAAQYDLE
jgi:hypothetical protein